MKPFRTLLLTAALAGTVLASSAGAASLSHTVAAGDTMWKLAVKYQVGTSEIIQANAHISNPDLIYPGQVLTIPQTDSTVSCIGSLMLMLSETLFSVPKADIFSVSIITCISV